MLASLLAAMPALAKKNEATPAELVATHGLVTARFHTAGLPPGVLGFAGSGAQTISLRLVGADGGGDDDIVLPWREGTPFSAGAWVPAGRYRIASWRESPWVEGPEVDVVAGRINDLGELLEVSMGGYDVVLTPLVHPELAGALDPWLAEVGDLLSSREPLRWSPSEVPKPFKLQMQSTSGMYAGGLIMDLMQQQARKTNRTDERTRLRAIRSPAELQRVVLDGLPPGRDDGALDADGRLYFGAGFGRIRVREPDGTWRTLDTGTAAAIDVVAWHDGQLLAASERGLLYASGDGGATWSQLKDFGANEAVRDIDHAAGRWFVVTVSLTERETHTKALTVHVASENDLSDLEVSRTFEQKEKFRWGWVPSGGAGGGYYYVNPHPALWRMDLETNEWTELDEKSANRFNVSRSTGAIALIPRTGLFLSTDHGQDWQRVAWLNGQLQQAWVDSPTQGWGTGIVFPSANTSAVVIARKAEPRGFKAWVQVAQTPLGCTRVLRDATGEPMFCATDLGSILRRDGDGWTPEYLAD